MKTKALISFTVTGKLICVFVFAYAKSRFSHDAAQIIQPGEQLAVDLVVIYPAGPAHSLRRFGHKRIYSAILSLMLN